jgi:hypothetical protein
MLLPDFHHQISLLKLIIKIESGNIDLIDVNEKDKAYLPVGKKLKISGFYFNFDLTRLASLK